MTARLNTKIWNLQNIILTLITTFPFIEEIYIFGSRGYGTRSVRSDIDLLVRSTELLPGNEVPDLIRTEFPPVDIFQMSEHNGCPVATSFMNGSQIYARNSDLIQQLDAKLLWSKPMSLNMTDGFVTDFTRWDQVTLRHYDFRYTVTMLPDAQDMTLARNELRSGLSDVGIPFPFLGLSWNEVGFSINQKVSIALEARYHLSSRAKLITSDNINFENEHDFQNFTYIILKPWLPDLQREPFIINFDDQDKYADFASSRNALVIEVKYIKNNNDKREVEGKMRGLIELYTSNPGVKLLIVQILLGANVKLDANLIRQWSGEYSQTLVIIEIFHDTPSKNNPTS